MSAEAAANGHIRARRAGFLADMAAVAERGLRSIPRDPETVIPSAVIPAFFFAVNVGALQDLAEGVPGDCYENSRQAPKSVIPALIRNPVPGP